jgi:transposase-like protein
MTDLSDPIFHDPRKAREHLESLRWAKGRFCPHCGVTEGTSPVKGKSHRPGLYYCNACKKQFSVTVGTIFERSHVPLNKWALAFHLMCASKKGMSAHQLHRMLGVTYKTAWFMAHRIRESMRELKPGPVGGKNKVVEADETYVGGKAKNRKNKVPPKEPDRPARDRGHARDDRGGYQCV